VNVRKLGVAGLGTMGAGIAQVAAQRGFEVVGVEVSDAAAAAATKRISSGLERFVRREKISRADADEALSRVHLGVDLDVVAAADVVIEAGFEDVAVKTGLFDRLDQIASPKAVLASNTSTIPLVILASATTRPERVVGMHFFNPVPMMQLVEVIQTPTVSPEVVSAVCELAEDLGKTPVRIQDFPDSWATCSWCPSCLTRSGPSRRASPTGSRSTR